jgi:hypothetical protein
VFVVVDNTSGMGCVKFLGQFVRWFSFWLRGLIDLLTIME